MMKLTSANFTDNGRLPGALAFAVPDPKQHLTLSTNRNPQLAWTGAPPGTRSFALICRDLDVPSSLENFNQEGRTVSKSLPRISIFHWLLVDLPPALTVIREGEFSERVTARGKGGPGAPHGARQGLNDYTGWFKDDKDMAGNYFGYDGPCPPWNDEIAHRYVFTVYALDVPRLAVSGNFGGNEVLKAMLGHILDEATLTGTYTLNPAVAA